jgi:beta propeller repeat protein
VVGLLAAIPLAQYAIAVAPDPGEPVDNEEQRVSEHGFRFGADQFLPDISGNSLVWQDQRGDPTTFNDPATGKPRNRIWFKSLATRDESPVTTLGTDFGHPRVSGTRAVWHDFVNGQHDIFTRVLPNGPIQQLTTNNRDQMNPAIDGNLVVWEDYRNGNADIFGEIVGGPPETAIVAAKGRQVSPSVSGNRVAWRDSRRGSTTADVWTRTGANAPVRAVKVTAPGVARSFSDYQVAISGNRLLWNEAYPGCTFDCANPKIVKTCTLPSPTTPCSSTVEVDSLPNEPEQGSVLNFPDVSTVGGTSLGSWVNGSDEFGHGHLYAVNLNSCSPPPCAAKTEVDTGDGFIPNGHLDGTRLIWSQDGFPKTGLEGGLDVHWDDLLTSSEPPRRANSLGLGPFGRHENPVADGDVVLYRAPGDGDFLNETQVWATDLSGTREHFAVSTELGTDTTRPAIVGTRAAWSDLRNCPTAGGPQVNDPCEVFPADDSFEKDPLDSGAEVRLSDPEQTGGPVDADGSTTVWRCGDTPGTNPDAICVHDGTPPVERVDIPSDNLLDPASTMGNLVRIDGDLVVWHEVFFPVDGDPQARLHVTNLTTLDDEVIADGVDAFEAGFDIAGSTIVFAPGDGTLYTNTATGCGGGGTSCNHSGAATVFEAPVLDRRLGSPAIDGDRVAWVDCDPFAENDCDIYTKTLGQTESNLVTNDTDSNVGSPYVDDALDRIYWVDGRNGSATSDVFMESIDDAVTLPGPDTTAPGPPTGFAATPASGPRRIELAWTNPGASDFFRVRILRSSGPGCAAPDLDDASASSPPFASLVYEDNGTTFTDTDVAAARKYCYSIFAFDLEPNFSAKATASATTP